MNEHLKIFEALRSKGIPVTKEQEELILRKFREQLSYTPKVAVFGKTGAGKSSLTNALFGSDVCKTNDISRCTVTVQEINVGGLLLYDCPGIGESDIADENYIKMYNELLPDMDAILWVIKGDDRAFTVDLQFYNSVISLCVEKGQNKNIPLYFVVNQVDKIEPFRKWDVDNHVPGSEQITNIQRKIQNVSEVFNYPINKIVGVSACENYNLVELVNMIIMNMPKQRVSSFWGKLNHDNLKQSTSKWGNEKETKLAYENTRANVKKASRETFVEIVKKVVKTTRKSIEDMLLSGIDKIWNGFCGFWGL